MTLPEHAGQPGRPAERLRQLEGVIERGLETFIEVGRALLEIRDSRLYPRDAREL